MYLKTIIFKIIYLCYRYLLYVKIVKPKIIVWMDGGIGSQMHQYLLGRIFKEKGYIVTYDLSWFKHNAKDVNRCFDRNFDLLKAFPYLDFKQSNRLERSIYMRFFAFKSNWFDHIEDDLFLYDLNPPKYLGGYYHSPKEVWTNLFPKYFKVSPLVLDSCNYLLYEEIKNNRQTTVGVHVRRGDLKTFNIAYGPPADILYFQKAFSYFINKVESPFFYFFSDEPKWIEEELIDKLSITEAEYKIVNINGSDKGYMDLFLIATCSHQISSKGAFGKVGALLRDSKDKIVILINDPLEYAWEKRLLNPVYL